jgi:hypothetical protein
MMQLHGNLKKEFLFAIASMLSVSACGHPEPISYESLVWVNNYYVEHPVSSLSASAGGWLFRGAREFGSEIRVGFLAQGAMNPDPAKRQAVLSSLCPARSESIWKVLSSNSNLVINVWTEDNKFKDSVTC